MWATYAFDGLQESFILKTFCEAQQIAICPLPQKAMFKSREDQGSRKTVKDPLIRLAKPRALLYYHASPWGFPQILLRTFGIA